MGPTLSRLTLTLMFKANETVVLHVLRSEAQTLSLSLSELPMVLGLSFA